MAKPKFNHVSQKDYIVEALKLTKKNGKQLLNWYYEGRRDFDPKLFEQVWGKAIERGTGFSITQYTGKMSYINVGDYLVKDVNGFYTHQGKEFEERYTPIN